MRVEGGTKITDNPYFLNETLIKEFSWKCLWSTVHGHLPVVILLKLILFWVYVAPVMSEIKTQFKRIIIPLQ